MEKFENLTVNKFDVQDAKNPYWSDSSHKKITLDVLFSRNNGNEGYLPFTASPEDSEQHGRKIFFDAKEGKYGPISEAPKTSKSQIEKEMDLRLKKASNILSTLKTKQDTLQDSINLKMSVEDAENNLKKIQDKILEWKKYRIAIYQTFRKKEKESEILWPDEPTA